MFGEAPNLVIEPMQGGDIPQILEIEREAFSTSWSEGAYRRELRWNRLARYLVLRQRLAPGAGGPGQEAAEGKPPPEPRGLARLLRLFRRPPPPPWPYRVLGYAGMWLMADEAHLIAIAVRREYRRRGLGEALLVRAIDLATELGARVMTLEVRASNLAAQAMYEKFGFRRVGMRPRYYSDNHEDALVMTSDILTSAPFQSRFQRLKSENRARLGLAQ
jgi:ribosomal-protein-alanine N-acetyltransferase